MRESVPPFPIRFHGVALTYTEGQLYLYIICHSAARNAFGSVITLSIRNEILSHA